VAARLGEAVVRMGVGSDAGREPRIGCVLIWPSIGVLFRTRLLPPLIEREGVDGRLYTGLAPLWSRYNTCSPSLTYSSARLAFPRMIVAR
jgi:hypothetical protein